MTFGINLLDSSRRENTLLHRGAASLRSELSGARSERGRLPLPPAVLVNRTAFSTLVSTGVLEATAKLRAPSLAMTLKMPSRLETTMFGMPSLVTSAGTTELASPPPVGTMATVGKAPAPSRYNSKLAAFSQRLLDKGMAPKAALVAVARTLLTILNALVRSSQNWNPERA